jgi:hypothetical protein
MNKLAVSSSVIFAFIVIATVLSYISIFFPYYNYGISFDNCITAGTEAQCLYGESLHIIALLFSVFIVGVILSYIILRFAKGKHIPSHGEVNNVFSGFSMPLLILMIFVFIFSFVALMLVNDFNNLDNNTDPGPAIYLLGTSVGLDFITLVLMIVHIFVFKGSMQ